MRRRHFEALHPVCPVCRPASGPPFALRLAQVVREEDEHIIEGALHCANQDCLREYPIVDGIPLIVVNIRQYVAENVLAIYGRRDLSDFVESMVGDCCGPGSAFEQTRQHLSSYAWDHYADLDPKEPTDEPRPGSMLRGLEAGCAVAQAFQPAGWGDFPAARASSGRASTELESSVNPQTGNSALQESADAPGTGPGPTGPVLDAGCSVGRGTFALAERSRELVLGVDLNFAMLRLASEVLRRGTLRYPRRRVGLVYERREFPVQFAEQENVDFWACDAAALPFPAGTFSFAASMNVLDCVHAPRELLASLGQVLREGGKAVLACPYDWSAAATPLETWLGGHSQRSPMAGSSEAVLRSLLTPGAHPGSINTLKLAAERENLAWHVRLHDRSTMTYKLHLVVAERTLTR